ncbi:MAG: DUF2520 domain-containing protein [Bacteroidetes bacterium]|nr:MAG: DUF2520 domain-containing protein [Bacteroidota bacterium]
MNLPEVDIIGTGNLATNLAPALEQNGFIVNNIYGRSQESAKEIANRLYQATAVNDLDFSSSKSSVFFITISDDAIEEVAREIILPDDAIIAHTSGTKSLSALGYTASPNFGVFYPVQTFSKAKRVNFENVPVLIEGGNRFTEKTLLKMAKKLSSTVELASSSQRRMVHLAAIFAGNFTNAMMAHANELMATANFDLQLLGPLVEETLNKSILLGPEVAQTGPARRGDLEVLDEHMQMLEKFPELQETYRNISQQILDRYDEES